MTDDPYRGGSQSGACPRCQSELASEGELRLTCARGCGEWYPHELVQHRVAWDRVIRALRHTATSWPWGTAALHAVLTALSTPDGPAAA